MSFQISTVYPDGTVETRDATPEEVAQREAEIAEAAEAQALRDAEIAAKEEARLSARAKLVDQGFTDAEIDLMYPTLA